MKNIRISPIALVVGFLLLMQFPQLLFFLLFLGGMLFVAYRFFAQKNTTLLEEQWKSFFQEKTRPITLSDAAPSFFSFFPKMPVLSPTKMIISIVFGFLIVFMIIDGFVNVPAGFVAVITDKGRGILENELPVGLHLKIPFWQNATLIDTRLQVYPKGTIDTSDTVSNADSIDALTKDGQNINIDITVQYLIPSEKADSILGEIGSPDAIEPNVIRPIVRSVVREAITSFDSKALFNNEGRTAASVKIEEDLRKKYEEKYLILDAALLRNIQFSEIYLNAIEEKQVAEQKIQKAEFEKQEAEIRKQKTVIEAQAEAEAITLKGNALRDNPEVIQLQFVEKMSPSISWGVLPNSAVPLLDLKSLQSK